MHPNQIKIAAAELYESCLKNPQPANDQINAYTRSRRYIGSKDRKKLTELVWTALRNKARLDYLFPNLSCLEKLEKLETIKNTTESLPIQVQLELPDFLIPYFQNKPHEAKALLEAAPTVLRANGDRDHIRSLLSDEGIDTEPTRLSPIGLILKKRTNLMTCSVYKNGLIEIQDEGSQLIALETGIRPKDHVLDYCAGAGGKTLIFAQMMKKTGMIVAHDIHEHRLKNLLPRADRAGCAHMIKTTTKTPQGLFDHVVVDAPCSGSGTWRRCPDAKWKLTPESLSETLTLQQNILNEVVSFVKSGAYLSYMTCSLLDIENQNQIDVFLKKHPDFQLIKTKQLTPATTNTDGFFMALFKKTA